MSGSRKRQTTPRTIVQTFASMLRWFGLNKFAKPAFNKSVLGILIFVLLAVLSIHALAFYYREKHKYEPATFGVTFISRYAKSFGLNPQETFDALRDDLGFKRFRLVSYWNEIERVPGHYDFSDLDWQFEKVEQVDGEVSLSIGLRQPRWPECHMPAWLEGQPESEWYPRLEAFMRRVIDRYKDHPSLDSYQLENEYFLGVFGECAHYGTPRSRLVQEYELVKSLDPKTPVILSLANNYFGIPLGDPRPDQYGVSVYKRVWDTTITQRYFEYPFTPEYYTARAALGEILTGKSSMLHELQAEPWTPYELKQASTDEQYKSMNPELLKNRVQYAVDTGFKDIDFWGGEWWYWRKTKLNDPVMWETAREQINHYRSLQH